MGLEITNFGAFLMVGEQSLQDTLNDVAKGLASGQISPKNSKRTIEAGKSLSEFEAFSALDPLLADLQKHYLDAKAQRVQAVREFGADDAMTDMAELMEDSAWCAVQTRYMELRADRALMREAQIMMLQSAEEEREQAQETREKEALKSYMQMQMISRMHEAEKGSSRADWWAVICFLISQPQQQFRNFYPAYQFNRMAA